MLLLVHCKLIGKEFQLFCKPLLLLSFCSEAGDICAMQLRLYLSVKLSGHQIAYKYQIYSHEIITSDEFIFCEEPGENINYYRILNLPWDKDGMYGCF